MSFKRPADTYAARMLEKLGDFRNEPATDYSKKEAQEALKAAMEDVLPRMPYNVPVIINGERLESEDLLEDLDPSCFKRTVAVSAMATAEQTDRAIAAAKAAYTAWSRTLVHERAAILVKAAAILRERKQFLCAIEVYEAAKPGAQALADLDEAIDFVEYYVRDMLLNADLLHMQPYLEGERNYLGYFPLGVVGVIGPWNFPGAIPIGMSAAALITGNTVILKPAEQTPLITLFWIEALEEAGLPAGVINYLPGRGEVAGARLVESKDVHMVIFTGSRDVGLYIQKKAAELPEGQHFVKRVVTEMGGKNALIIDEPRDYAKSAADAIYSAFGFSGQKCSACSRLLVLEKHYDAYIKALVEEAGKVIVGPADETSTLVGPVIDDEAREKVRKYIKIGKESAETLYGADIGDLDKEGFFVAPHIFAVDSADHPLMQEEIFGPVLAVMKVKDFDEALEVANSTPYALTGGVHSTNRQNLERAVTEFQCGNLYFNRTIVGAIVERQPFGGFKLSGIGSKTGGPDYLKQFLVARTIAEKV